MRLADLPALALLGVFGGGALVIVALYTIRWRVPERVVSSLSLWLQAARGKGGGGQIGVIEHVLSLLLQLFMFALLVLAAGRPRLGCQSHPGRAVVIVLDRSLSMGALEKVEPRLETARRRALERLRTSADDDVVAVVLAGGEPEVAVPLQRDRVPAQRAIGGARLVATSGHLDRAVQVACALARARDEASVVVLTDGTEPFERCDGDVGLETERIGTARPNLGITALSAAAPPRDPLHPSAFIEVTNGADRRASAQLRLALDGSLVQVAELSLGPGETVRQLVPRLQPNGVGRLEARLVDIRFQGGGADALPDDDQAVTLLPRAARLPVQLVGNDEALRLVLAANQRFELGSPRAAAEGVTVISGAIDQPLPPGRYLLIAWRGDGAAPLRVGEPLSNPRITEWRAEHPILRRVVLSDVQIERTARLSLPASAVPLLSSPETPLLFAWEDDTRRVVGMGFQPTRSNLPLRVAFPVLVYDAIEWLAQSADVGPRSTGVSRKGEATLAPRFAPSTVIRPSGRRRDAELQPWLVLGALALLCAEWLSWHRRRTV